MTLSDPLLKELKGHICALTTSGPGPYTDNDDAVFSICHTLESIFQKGLIRHDGFTPWRTDCFQWFHQLVRKYNRVLPLTFRGAFDDVMGEGKIRTNAGKTRLLIRHCLKRKCLHTPVQFHVENNDFLDTTLRVNYNPNSSVLGHEILSQIFLSLLLQLSHYEFLFDLSNSSFLDESWQIPTLFKTELVPCDKLGLTLGFPMGYAVIVRILEHSVAAEFTDKIEVGDILDELNGTPVRHFYGSKIESLFKKCKKAPFNVTFIKSKDIANGQIFLPAIKLYRILGMDPELLNYPEPAYRRRAITNKTLDTSEFDTSSETTGSLCDNEQTDVEPAGTRAQVQEEQLIDVEIEAESNQTRNDDIGSNPENSSSYMQLLSTLSVPPESPIDLLTSDAVNLQDAPAQLILESNDNGVTGTTSEEAERPSALERDQHGNFYNSQSSQYYDDTHPFLV